MQRFFITALTLATVSLGSTTAHADECAPTPEVDPLRLLRQTSLDVRGEVPSFEEYARVRDAEDRVAEVELIIEEMFDGDAYRRMLREYHAGLLWSTVDEAILPRLPSPQAHISAFSNALIWRAAGKRTEYRGDNIDCLNQEQPADAYDASGRPTPLQTYQDPACRGGTCRREGWVWVEPYWAPGTEVRVCAWDAQTFDVGETGESCDDYTVNDNRCGCGPNLIRCGRIPNTLVPDADVDARRALAEEPLRIFEEIITEDRSYLDAFTTQTSFVNGPAAHYHEWLTGVNDEERGNSIVGYDAAYGHIPALGYPETDTWVQIEREGSHAGVLTTFAYLIRFASNRARANRFYTAFYCDPFIPPEGGIPAEEGDPPANLRERNGCDGCHEVLEPAAAHWGRWRTGGTFGLLREDLVSFDVPRDECASCAEGGDEACTPFCQSYYITADNAHPDEYAQFAGMPQASIWLSESEKDALEVGPSALLDEPHEQRRVAQCTVRNLAQHLYGRELQTDDLAWIEAQTDALQASNYSFNDLMRRLIEDPRYRSID